MAASLVNRLGSRGGLFLGSIVALAIHSGAGVYPADARFDQGASSIANSSTAR